GLAPDGQVAEHDVPVRASAQLPRRLHHPPHAEARAEVGRLAFLLRPGAPDFLQGDDVGLEAGQDLDDPVRAQAPVHAAALVNVVGDKAELAAGVGRARRTGLWHDRQRAALSAYAILRGK